jgi:hypothetical protein
MSKTGKTTQTPAPMPDPDQRVVEKKPDEQTHSRLVEEAEKGRK